MTKFKPNDIVSWHSTYDNERFFEKVLPFDHPKNFRTEWKEVVFTYSKHHGYGVVGIEKVRLANKTEIVLYCNPEDFNEPTE